MLDWSLADYDQAVSLINRPDVVSGMVREGSEDYPPQLPCWESAKSYITNSGGWYFLPLADRIYEAHVFYLKAARGRLAFEHSRRVFQDMSHKADRLIGQIAIENCLACRFVERLGCRLVDLKTGDYWIGNRKTDLGLFVYEFEKDRRLCW